MDVLKSAWFRKSYFFDEGMIRPLTGDKMEPYNPFDYYRKGNRIKDNLHHLFASIDPQDSNQVVTFFNNYGPLGIIGRDIAKITKPYKLNNKKTGLLVVPHDSEELIPVAEFLDRYNVPIETFVNKYINTNQIPTLFDVSIYTGESIELFSYHQERFCWVLDMLTALYLKEKDDSAINELLLDSRQSICDLIRSTGVQQSENRSQAEMYAVAMETVLTHINNELANRTSVKLVPDTARQSISQELEWSFDSLLTALYMMVLMDIERGVISRSCAVCDQYFETNRQDIVYCSSKCQTRINTRNHRDRELKQLVIEMFKEEKTVEEIAAKTGRDKEQIESWKQKYGKA